MQSLSSNFEFLWGIGCRPSWGVAPYGRVRAVREQGAIFVGCLLPVYVGAGTGARQALCIVLSLGEGPSCRKLDRAGSGSSPSESRVLVLVSEGSVLGGPMHTGRSWGFLVGGVSAQAHVLGATWGGLVVS